MVLTKQTYINQIQISKPNDIEPENESGLFPSHIKQQIPEQAWSLKK